MSTIPGSTAPRCASGRDRPELLGRGSGWLAGTRRLSRSRSTALVLVVPPTLARPRSRPAMQSRSSFRARHRIGVMPQDTALENSINLGIDQRRLAFAAGSVGTALYPNRPGPDRRARRERAELVTPPRSALWTSPAATRAGSGRPRRYRLLPHTAAVTTALDAILTAHLAREALDTNWVKLELSRPPDALSRRVAAAKPLQPWSPRLRRAALLQRGIPSPAGKLGPSLG